MSDVDVEALTVLRFNKAYKGTGLTVRFLPDAKIPCLRWQCVRPNNGHVDLIACASTPRRLVESIRARSWRASHNGRNGH
jgi:hypothetical protein